MKLFTVRVYGVLINNREEVLLSDEFQYGARFTKFPGGGLEYGEGLIHALVREFQEECAVEVDVIRHIHTTEHFIKSAFDDRQVIAVHYLVQTKQLPQGYFGQYPFDFIGDTEPQQVFRWVPIMDFDLNQLTFETDRDAWRRFTANYK